MSKFSGMALSVDKTARMTIIHPITRQPLRYKENDVVHEGYIDLYSGDSKVARQHERAVTTRRLGMRGRAKLSAEEIEAEGVELLAALTAGWKLVSLDGALLDVPFNLDNARELYADHTMAWLREQVNEFTADRGNFSAAS